MSKQRPNPDKLANELAGASAFFRQTEAIPPADNQPASPAPATTSQTTVPTQQTTPVRPGRRVMIRHPFELYADQLDRLRELAEQQKRQGETGSMSKMVREAIDRLLDEQLP